jgi:hypothetical protein
MNSSLYELLESSMAEPTFIPLSSVQGEHYVCPICDRLSVHGAFVWCLYRTNTNTSPAPWGGKYLSTDKEVRFGNKSESDMLQENQKILIHFWMKQHPDISWKFFVNKNRTQIGWPCKKMMEYGLWVYGILNSLLMVVLFLHIKIMWIATVEKSENGQCEFIMLSSFNFSMQSTKRFQTSILFMITILCLFVTSTTMMNRNIQTSFKTRLPISICGWVRGFSLVTYNWVTM